jgi:hypothetical protein
VEKCNIKIIIVAWSTIVKKVNLFIRVLFIASLLFAQVGGVLAAPAFQNATPVAGVVQKIVLETDPTTGVTIVIVDLLDNNQVLQSVRLNQETAIELGLVVLDGDGQPGINNLALGKSIEIDPGDALPTQHESQHPVGSALATFFADIAGVDYDSIMAVHEQGVGFGIIAQMLWLTKKLDGDLSVFQAIVQAKQTGDYSAFLLADGSTPTNWGQLRKSILEKNNNLKLIMSDRDKKNDHGNNSNNNGGNGNGNGGGNGNGNGGNNGTGGGNGNQND